MAQEKKTSFPMLPVAHWWKLREKFNQSIPGVVTDNYLAATLNMQPKSARVNILPYLKTIGLVDEEGKTQDLAKEWRDDGRYPEVCKKMKEALYPDDLISAVPNPSADRDAVARWFANRTGAGESAVGRMTAFYLMLSEADVSGKPEKKVSKREAARKPSRDHVKTNITEQETKPSAGSVEKSTTGQLVSPSININLEIHISADATPDQIDKIFESMAKHVYGK